jgi:hypothetical protein
VENNEDARPGPGSQAVVRVRLVPAASRPGFEQYLRTLTCVVGAWRVTGGADYELLVTCPAVSGLSSVLACLRSCSGTEVTSTALVLREIFGPTAGSTAAQPAGLATAGRGDDGD